MAPEYGEKMSSRVQGVQETNRSEEIQAHGKVESTAKSVSPMHGEQSVHMQQEDVHGFMQQEDVPYSEVVFDPMQAEVEATARNWQVVRKKKEKQHSTAASHVHKVIMGLDPKKGTDCVGRVFSASFVGILFFLSLCACDREEVDDPQRISQEDVKVITGHEYVSRLHELKDEINRAWHAEDHVTALKLTIQVAKLLMDTSVLQFYPTLFVLATDVLDMLGDMCRKDSLRQSLHRGHIG
ncbi:hypothetical protein DKX38_024197 [Salix brachista]|uniref:Uncharacterized protein n=1 Tax=Salix brachista TaxID=2182728 RepID=A0A5N5JKS3_9ROSI|nr:hypothetical protein DKX38_024197 [Salix brachista]